VPPRDWPLAAVETVLQLRIFELRRHHSTSPRTGSEHDFYVLCSADWCNIVPLTDDGDVVMIRQFRHGTRQVTLEIPGGVVDPEDASPLSAAGRELLEETGYGGGHLEPIGIIAPNPAIQSNRCHSFVARGVRRLAAPSFDPAEDIEVALIPLLEIPSRIAAGEISHALVIVAFTWLLGLRPPDRS
jgi:8-oxo-dGTP pyrophosphatase MutT (NUDIX family)